MLEEPPVEVGCQGTVGGVILPAIVLIQDLGLFFPSFA